MMVLDAGYKTPPIARELLKEGIQPLFPYKCPMTKEGFLRNMNMSMMNTMTAISARQTRFLHIGQQIRRGIGNIKAIRTIARIVLIFPMYREQRT